MANPCGNDSEFFDDELEIKSLPSVSQDISTLTEISLEGNGILDILLRNHRMILNDEYQKGRIQGKEYSDVFIKTYGTNLDAGIRLLEIKERQWLDLQLLQTQVAQAKEQTLLIKAQKCEVQAKTELTNAQTEKVKKETELLGWQIKIAIQELKIREQELLIKLEELAIAREQLKLVIAQVRTEKAQTISSVIEPQSVLGRQVAVLNAQIEGYKRDAEQKAAQLMIETWITRMNNDAALANEYNTLRDDNIGKSVENLLKGAGISNPATPQSGHATPD